jgi:hypothetical protein
MKFFVPKADDETKETIYVDLAGLCRSPVLPANQRVYSITFIHDGEEWTATVGRTLSGTRTRKRQRRGQRIDVTVNLSDSATVLAIFSGSPFQVVTDAHPVGGSRSNWGNPFMAGNPSHVELFED